MNNLYDERYLSEGYSDREKTKVVYITSPSHSGSTLLSMLMGNHPNIATVSELTGLIPGIDQNTYKCSCGVLLKDCQFWANVRSVMEDAGEKLTFDNYETAFYPRSLNKFIRWMIFRSSGFFLLDLLRDRLCQFSSKYQNYVERIARRNVIAAKAILRLSNKPVFLDASKDPIRIKFLSMIREFNLKVIHLTRDARAVSNSYKKNNKLSVLKGAKDWKRNHNLIRAYTKGYQCDVLRIKYEDLCMSTHNTLNDIFSFCGVSNEVNIDFSIKNQHLIGNKMRLKESLNIKLDESWKVDLVSSEIEIIKKVCGRLNIEFGYE